MVIEDERMSGGAPIFGSPWKLCSYILLIHIFYIEVM